MKRYSSKFDRTLDDFISEEPSAQRVYRPRGAHRSNYSRTSFQGVNKRSQREHAYSRSQRAHRFNTQETTQMEFRDSNIAAPELTSVKIQIVNPNAKPKESPKSEVINAVSQNKNNSPALTAETASQLVQDAILKTLPQLMSSMVQSQQTRPQVQLEPSPNPGNPQVTQVRVQSISMVPPVEFTSRSINEIFATISKSSSSDN